MKKWFKLFSLLTLALVFVFSFALVACESNQETPGGNEGENPGGSQGENPGGNEGENPGGNEGENPGGEDQPTAPVITITGEVPTTGTMGRAVTIPAATAVNYKGTDISGSVKVTVAGVEEDGQLDDSFLYEEPANVERKFTPRTLTDYKITYFVRDSESGLRGEKAFDFKAEEDKTGPVITVTEEGFDVTQGIHGDNYNGFRLPAVKAVDQPGDVDVSNRITYTITLDGATVDSGNYSHKAKYFVPGTYQVTYNATDTARNQATPVTFPLVIDDADLTGKNLLGENGSNAVCGYDAGINDYGELMVGKTSWESLGWHGDDNYARASIAGKKIKFGDYVGLSMTMDPVPKDKGEMFFSIGLAWTQSDGIVPTAATGDWPKALMIRFETSKVGIYRDDGGGGLGSKEISYRDGKNHVYYMQYTKTGDSADDTNAAITLNLWVDAKPAEDNVWYSVTLNKASGIAEDRFKNMFNSDDGLWLIFGSYTGGAGFENHADDVMTVKSIGWFPSTETEFALDLTAPEVTVEEAPKEIYALNEQMGLPSASATDNGESTDVKIYLKAEDGTKTEIEANYIPQTAGKYTLIYEAKDAAGNYGYATYQITIAARDSEAPVITLSSETAITAQTGVDFDLPTATAQDNADGDLTSQIRVDIVGPDWTNNIGNVTSWKVEVAGDYLIRYSVSDSFGNLAEKEVTVTVTGVKEGDVVSGMVGYDAGKKLTEVGSGMNAEYKEQKVYTGKVSMVINVKSWSDGIIFFNVLGDVGDNREWPDGMVIRMLAGGSVDVSGWGHDKFVFGHFNHPFMDKIGTDVVFEYEITRFSVSDTEYLRVRIWFDGVEATASADAGNGAQLYTDVVTSGGNGGGVVLPVSKMLEKAEKNLKAGYLFIRCHAGVSIEIKALRIDGTSCTLPVSAFAPDMTAILPTRKKSLL